MFILQWSVAHSVKCITVLVLRSFQPVFGHSSSTDSSPFRQTREGELHFVEDAEVSFNNAVCNSYFPKSLGKASIKGMSSLVSVLSILYYFFVFVCLLLLFCLL